MMVALAIDASTAVGTAALIGENVIVGETTAAMRGEHEERLMPAVVELLRSANVGVSDLNMIACGDGPGSFTSLRIAAAIAKGLAAANTLPLAVAPSPVLIVAGAVAPLERGTYLAVLDAMRGDVFALPVRVTPNGVFGDGDAALMSRADAEAFAASLGATIVGPAEAQPRAPHARGFGVLIWHGLTRRVDAASWEPTYGRKAEAQVRWEQTHGRPLATP